VKLRTVDYLSPEDVAMLQALYSRSAESVDRHLEKVAETGSGKFMDSYYVGYGHKSIADCGSTTMFIEGVSLLAAKAVQDWPLYSGQETSTRYIDMGSQPIIDPIATYDSAVIIQCWMDFYRDNQKRVAQTVRERYPRRVDEKEESYERAVKARTFDILRGFLPAGITTQLSWHTNLRQAADHLIGLSHHPLGELRELAVGLTSMLDSKYPSSGFKKHLAMVSGIGNKRDVTDIPRAAWEARVGYELAYSTNIGINRAADEVGDAMLHMFRENIGAPADARAAQFADILKTRPRGCVLPHFMSDLGRGAFEFLLDFGSFRDIQRHRNGVCRMPLLDTYHGFELWYLDQLDDELRDEARGLIERQEMRLTRLTNHGCSDFDRQYYVALGYRVPTIVNYALPALIYVIELRSSKTVHPTLRRKVLQIARAFKNNWPDIALHVDEDPDDWDVRRGEQTITKKG
jgi:thymidylate synthase ThyX